MRSSSIPDPSVDDDWREIASHWDVRKDTCYLNHGSFGISPREVLQCRREWQDRLDAQPMDYYLRQLEPAFYDTRKTLGGFLNAEPENLVFVENSTYGMNVIANSFPLQKGDEVLLTSHEYGAVKRIWERKCRAVKSTCTSAELQVPFRDDTQILDSIFQAVTSKTKLLVVSHITSETGTILPVREICERARQLGIATCIDGPHAPAQVELDLRELDCDFYTASCHKWLCATLGSGFLFVNPQWQSYIEPLVQSWGRLNPNQPQTWDEEFIWMGTRDPAPFFAVAKAIEFLDSIGFDHFRRRTRYLADTALDVLIELFGTQPLYPIHSESTRRWYGSMCELPLPDHLSAEEKSTLQSRLWNHHQIEVPVFEFAGQKLLRVSFHLYNSRSDIDKLVSALTEEGCRPVS